MKKIKIYFFCEVNMGCGCGGNRRGVGRRPVVAPRNNRAVRISAAKTPTQLTALAIQQTVEGPAGMSKERRELERRKRARIALRAKAGLR